MIVLAGLAANQFAGPALAPRTSPLVDQIRMSANTTSYAVLQLIKFDHVQSRLDDDPRTYADARRQRRFVARHGEILLG